MTITNNNKPVTCTWSQDSDSSDVFSTSCGDAFVLICGTLKLNHMKYCCYCGRPIKQEIVIKKQSTSDYRAMHMNQIARKGHRSFELALAAAVLEIMK